MGLIKWYWEKATHFVDFYIIFEHAFTDGVVRLFWKAQAGTWNRFRRLVRILYPKIESTLYLYTRE